MNKVGHCPICGQKMKKMIKAFLWCDADQFTYDKKAIRTKAIKVSGVMEDDPMRWICQQHGTFEGILKKMEQAS
jgi:hypothetical protein